MTGGIYADGQVCPICGGNFKDTGRSLICLKHPKQHANRFRIQFKGVWRYGFNSYDYADQELSVMRYKFGHGKYDERDYSKDQPLGFSNLADQYLSFKRNVEKKKSTKKMEYHLSFGKSFFENRNIKELGEGELQDLQATLPYHLSDKTKQNIFTTIHALWEWVRKRERKRNPYFYVPEFPAFSPQIKPRAIFDKETQYLTLEEVKRIAPEQKIYIGCLWLSTYPSVRPGELVRVKEKDFDLQNGILLLNETKEGKTKILYLIEEDVEMAKSFPRSFPELYFFRHPDGRPYGKKLFWKYWRLACKNCGGKYVSLYPGTKHTTATDLMNRLGKDAAKEATGHKTDKAFGFYISDDPSQKRRLYEEARFHKENTKNFDDFLTKKNDKVLKLNDK